MGYTKNILARGLKRSRSQTIGTIIPSIENFFYVETLKYIDTRLFSQGYKMLVHFLHNEITSERDALEVLSSYRPEAILFSPRDRENQNFIETLVEAKINIIQLYTAPYKQYNSLIIDDIFGTQLATEYLLSMGHRRIMYFGYDIRVAGYRSAFRQYGLEVDEALITNTSKCGEEGIFEAIKANDATAVLCIALESEKVWNVLNQKGVKIPDDLSFVAYDDLKWVKMLGITAISHPVELIAEKLADQITRLINGENDTPEHILIKPSIIERKSVRRLDL